MAKLAKGLHMHVININNDCIDPSDKLFLACNTVCGSVTVSNAVYGKNSHSVLHTRQYFYSQASAGGMEGRFPRLNRSRQSETEQLYTSVHCSWQTR